MKHFLFISFVLFATVFTVPAWSIEPGERVRLPGQNYLIPDVSENHGHYPTAKAACDAAAGIGTTSTYQGITMQNARCLDLSRGSIFKARVYGCESTRVYEGETVEFVDYGGSSVGNTECWYEMPICPSKAGEQYGPKLQTSIFNMPSACGADNCALTGSLMPPENGEGDYFYQYTYTGQKCDDVDAELPPIEDDQSEIYEENDDGDGGDGDGDGGNNSSDGGTNNGSSSSSGQNSSASNSSDCGFDTDCDGDIDGDDYDYINEDGCYVGHDGTLYCQDTDIGTGPDDLPNNCFEIDGQIFCPDIDGDGEGDGDTDGDGEGSSSSSSSGSNTSEDSASSEGTASGGDTCGSPPSCSGDEIQCAMLLQQYYQRCPGIENTTEKPGTYDGEADHTLNIQDRLQQSKDEFKSMYDNVANDLKSHLSLSVSGSGGDLPCESIEIKGKTLETGVCVQEDFWTKIRGLLVAAASLIAAYIILVPRG